MTAQYKGKLQRSWPQLPPELVRHIATFYLWDLSVTNFCPQVWDSREHWHPRMVFAALRDTKDMEKLMLTCPQWSLALETHLFWNQAITLLDPLDFLAHHAIVPPKPPPAQNSHSHSNSVAAAAAAVPPTPLRLTPFRHFRNITGCSCLVCRINAPGTNMGLTLAKRSVHTPFLGLVGLCREHERRRAAFCGLCLREAPIFESAHHANNAAGNPDALVACIENEDEETWPNVEATCRTCRREWLWRRVAHIPQDAQAIGGARMISEDWETRQCVDGFVEMGEGAIGDVVGLAREKWWLRRYTRLGDMMGQALAATRFEGGQQPPTRTQRNGYAQEEEEEEEEYEDEEEEESSEDDVELLQMTEEGGVRDLALGDWARTRILDGFWVSPADIWYGNKVPGWEDLGGVRALHPCPWAREEEEQDEEPPLVVDDEVDDDHERRPKQSTLRSPIPPSYALCEQAYIAHQRQMRVVLLPAMRNIVRRLVIECACVWVEARGECVDGDGCDNTSSAAGGAAEDPGMRAAKLGLEDVLKVLREEEGVWFDGVDWAERRKNDLGREREQRQREREDHIITANAASTTNTTGSTNGSSAGSDDSRSSGNSSNVTSPVLSTTTLQTTPSPPPIPGEEAALTAVHGWSPSSTDDEAFDSNQKDTEADTKTTTRQKVVAPPVTIPISPVLDPPRLLRPIPYVPMTLAHLPHYSTEAFRVVWREACAPLYHCRCKICERAMAKANAANGSAPSMVPSQIAPISPRQQKSIPPVLIPEGLGEHGTGIDVEELVLIRLEEEEGESEEGDGEEVEAQEEEDSESKYGGEDEDVREISPPPELTRNSRKRACDEVDEDGDEDGSVTGHDEVESVEKASLPRRRARDGTPPKRARREEGAVDTPMATTIATRRIGTAPAPPPVRMRKRSSEELAEDGSEEDGAGAGNKRIRVEATEDDGEEIWEEEDGDVNSLSPPTTTTTRDSIPPLDETDDDVDAHSPPTLHPPGPGQTTWIGGGGRRAEPGVVVYRVS